MCQFLELEFSCSSDNHPHRLRTRSICPCDNPLGCLAEEIAASESKAESETVIEDWEDGLFSIMKVDGVCGDCAQKKTKELEDKEKILGDIETNLVKMDQDLDRLSAENLAKSRRGIPTLSLPQLHDDRAEREHEPETICSSGWCKGLVAVSLDGRRGFFCQKHTCAAADWGCLLDKQTEWSTNPRKRSHIVTTTTITYSITLITIVDRLKASQDLLENRASFTTSILPFTIHVDPMVFQWPWIAELCRQISKELRQNIDWIGIKPPSSRPTKLLDYACGHGVASRALAPFMSTVRGIDISSSMVDKYNEMAQQAGYMAPKMLAVQGDLIDPKSTPSPELNSAEFSDFDVIVMCMALHHIEDHDNMILQLSKRLRQGGILVTVDWVAESESNCFRTNTDQLKDMASHTATRMGFKESDVRRMFERAGLKDWSWKWALTRSLVPREIGGEQQLFLARGRKP
ncbi:hypothetical protein F66182_6209 [Fusarium sp. NRRL 66182]|nr:hypothetical protein F66182_6209 [Fusarium sp. NRRL 66182]